MDKTTFTAFCREVLKSHFQTNDMRCKGLTGSERDSFIKCYTPTTATSLAFSEIGSDAQLCLSKEYDGIRIVNLSVPQPNQGHGTGIMLTLQGIADELGVNLYVHTETWDANLIDAKRRYEFFKKFDFEVHPVELFECFEDESELDNDDFLNGIPMVRKSPNHKPLSLKDGTCLVCYDSKRYHSYEDAKAAGATHCTSDVISVLKVDGDNRNGLYDVSDVLTIFDSCMPDHSFIFGITDDHGRFFTMSDVIDAAEAL